MSPKTSRRRRQDATVAPPLGAPAKDGRSGMQRRLLVGYVILGLAVVAVVAVSIYFGLIRNNKATPWSSWKPDSQTAQGIEDQIAQHVEQRYLGANGKPLAVVGFGPLAVDAQQIQAIGYVKNAKSAPQFLASTTTDNSVRYDFSGSTTGAPVNDGSQSILQSYTLRQEALELALYTFKYIPSMQTVIVFMPPKPLDPGPTLSMYVRPQAAEVLKVPLDQTIGAGNPPLQNKVSASERQRILRLTNVFRWSPGQTPDKQAALLVTPSS